MVPETRALRAVAAVCLAGLVLAPLPAASRATVEGRWELVEQTYGDGRSGSADDLPPLRIEFSRQGRTVTGRIWVEGSEERVAEWPALVSEGQSGPVRVLERSVSESGDRVEVRYEASHGPEGDGVLEIVEWYGVAEGGAALVGSVTVRLRQGGGDAGGYVLRRRFERRP